MGLGDKDKMLSFVIQLLYWVVTRADITIDEIQALENICREFPEVDVDQFLY